MQKKKDKIRSGDRFMPCLLERLTDQNPQLRTEVYSRGISEKHLKQDIMWNLEVILNSRSHLSSLELNNDETVINSVLGMGLPDFCGMSHSREQRENLRQAVFFQLKNFEPRINPDSLTVKVINEESSGAEYSVLKLEIHGMVDVPPLREELVFKSSLDLESGVATVALQKDS